MIYKAKQQLGFSLIEILVVMFILGLLGAIAVPQFFGQIDKAYTTKAQQDIKAIQSGLDIYRLDKGDYPNSEEGLAVLVNNYLNKLPQDPWGADYVYLNPGTKCEIDVYTLGKDRVSGGSGNNADIFNC